MKKQKMTDQQRAVVAALLGVSNAGQDMLFRGRHPSFTPEKIKKMLGASVDSVTYNFVSGLCEDEAMLDMFVSEAKSWYKNLRNHSLADLKRVHKDYVPFFEALE